MLHEAIDSFGGDVFFEGQRLDNLAHLREHFRLDESLMRLLRRPLPPKWLVHDPIELLSARVWMWQLLQHVLVSKLLVTASVEIAFVQYDALQSLILPFLFELGDLIGLELLCACYLSLKAFVNYTSAGPFVPAAFNIRHCDFTAEFLFNFCFFFFLELVHDGVGILSYEQF